jgi:alpha-L-rhamnosidase
MLVGDLVIWFYECLAGIQSDPACPGFKHILMKPHPVGDLKFVKASYQSAHGLIRSEWERPDSHFRWKVTLPPNTSATLFVPAHEASQVREGKRPAGSAPGVKFLRQEGDRAVFQVASGSYDFSVP